jgi:hypothetical protein
MSTRKKSEPEIDTVVMVSFGVKTSRVPDLLKRVRGLSWGAVKVHVCTDDE